MKMIFSVDQNWGIGKDGNLLHRAKGDMVMFKDMTEFKVVVVGRRTLESLPDGKILPNRTTIILSRNDPPYISNKGYQVIPFEMFFENNTYLSDSVFIIGGGEIYKAMEPYCSAAIVTKWKALFEADTYAPNLDENPDWFLKWESEDMEEDSVKYSFSEYINKFPKKWRNSNG